jgi:Ser/Thr protein kinase RdoA (MazF antagonist)
MMNESPLQETVLDCLARNYGIQGGGLRRLPGENLNFLVTADGGQRYVCKIVGDEVSPEVVEMEDAAIEHAVSRGFDLDLPEIVENKFNTLETGIILPLNNLNRLRIIRFISGNTLSSMFDISLSLLKNVGESLALFGNVMQGFDHPAAHRDHRWNLATAGQHETTIQRFSDREQRRLLAWAYSGWRGVRGRLGRLQWQFVHGDAHDENWMVERGRVTGLIDFGDCCYNPAVCDLAICLAYLMMRDPDPLQIAAAVIEGYQGVRALPADELAALYPLICARLAVSVCVAMERRAIDPSNPNWFGGEESAWSLLGQLQARGEDEFLRCLQ